MLATYFRNNVLHLFAHAVAARLRVRQQRAMRTEDIQRLAWRIYPYIAAELFLRWSESELASGGRQRARRAGAARAASKPTGERTAGAGRRRPRRRPMQLSLLAQATIQTIERYYLAVALLLQAGSGEITQAALEERCQLMAQRMTMLYGFNSPEFFDRAMFKQLHRPAARARRDSRLGGDGKLEFDEVLVRVAAGCAARAQRADAPQHPAGHARLRRLAAASASNRLIDTWPTQRSKKHQRPWLASERAARCRFGAPRRVASSVARRPATWKRGIT